MEKNKYDRRLKGIQKARKVLAVLRPGSNSDFYDVGGVYEKELIHTRVACSCPDCGNQRRHFGRRTVQELKSDFDMIDQLEEE